MLNSEYKNSSLKIFSLKGSEALAQEIAGQIGAELGRCSVKRFSDGRIQINAEESIRGCDVFIIQPTSYPANLHLMELLIMIDACKRAPVATISIVVPYYGYARQDRKTRNREPITAKLVAGLIKTAGVTRMIALDLHAPQVQGFSDISIDHLMSVPILAKHLKDDPDINPEECVVVSSGHGDVTRARKLADILKTPVAIMDKRRPRPNVAEMMNIVGETEERTTIIIDDTVDTVGTIASVTQALKDKGVKEVYACYTHPVLSGPAKERIENSVIKELIVTNSIRLDEDRKSPSTKGLSVAGLIAQTIIRVYERESVSVLFD